MQKDNLLFISCFGSDSKAISSGVGDLGASAALLLTV